jgi:HNH endonuclease
MRCIFCKKPSFNSRSREHIIPESLGNTTQVLSAGVVCDSCNNYFGREVEGPFLTSPAVSEMRFHQGLPNKRGKVPAVEACLDHCYQVTAYRHLKGPFIGSVTVTPAAFAHVLARKCSTILFAGGGQPPDTHVVSRFLAKAAVEALVLRVTKVPGGQDYVVDEVQFDPIRRHARERYPRDWPYSQRRIYHPNRKVVDERGESLQMVHEHDFLQTSAGELFFVLAIFGLEFAINVGGPDIEGYHQWCEAHGNLSPLYTGKNAVVRQLAP